MDLDLKPAPSDVPSMSAKRFKLIMRFRSQQKELDKEEEKVHQLAKNLAMTADCLGEALEREEFLKRETEQFLRKAAKAKTQLEQEKSDKDIIMQDLDRVKAQREKLVQSGKTSFKRKVMPEEVSAASGGRERPARQSSTFYRSSSKLIQPKQSMQDDSSARPELTESQKSTLNLRGGSNRRAKSVVGGAKKQRGKKAADSEFDDLGLSGASYTPLFN